MVKFEKTILINEPIATVRAFLNKEFLIYSGFSPSGALADVFRFEKSLNAMTSGENIIITLKSRNENSTEVTLRSEGKISFQLWDPFGINKKNVKKIENLFETGFPGKKV
ncbi:MAG: hypothetical protein ACT6QS_02460 [Flavobacteriales bacterium]